MPSDKRMLSIGIWLELPPGLESLKGEGMFTQLSEVMKRLTQQPDVHVVVAMASWTQGIFRDAIQDAGIPLERLEIMTPGDRLPVAARAWEFIKARRKRVRPPRISVWSRLVGKALGLVSTNRVLRSLLATKSYVIAILLAVPVLFAGGLAFALYSLASFFKRVAVFALRRVLPARKVPDLDDAVELVKTRKDGVTGRIAAWIHVLYGSIAEYEHELLAVKAGQRKDIDVWFAPMCTYSSAYHLPEPLVVNVADLVYVGFPTKFHDGFWLALDQKVQRLAERATLTVSYSEHVREHHVRRHLGVPDERTRVIRHAPRILSDYRSGGNGSSGHDGRSVAARILRHYFEETNPKNRSSYWTEALPSGYLARFPFDEARFIFVCSQVRPHKNVLNLVRAVEHVLRRKYLPVKLFLSGRLESDKEVVKYVKRQHLEMDVISVRDLPLGVMAAFYRLASLTCMPSLFEGGFPFQFSESLSAGTPIVMSSIPVTREIIPPELEDTILFDPYDVDSIAERLSWGLTHREELLKKEMPLYNVMVTRTWRDVADDYRKVFEEAISLHKASSPGPALGHTHVSSMTRSE